MAETLKKKVSGTLTLLFIFYFLLFFLFFLSKELSYLSLDFRKTRVELNASSSQSTSAGVVAFMTMEHNFAFLQ